MLQLNTDIRSISGIGDARAKTLEKLGISTLQDLISYFPRAYEDRSVYKRIADLLPGERACVTAMVASPAKNSHIRKGLDLLKVRVVDESGSRDLTFFNRP